VFAQKRTPGEIRRDTGRPNRDNRPMAVAFLIRREADAFSNRLQGGATTGSSMNVAALARWITASR
jgi:hypothetical protein